MHTCILLLGKRAYFIALRKSAYFVPTSEEPKSSQLALTRIPPSVSHSVCVCVTQCVWPGHKYIYLTMCDTHRYIYPINRKRKKHMTLCDYCVAPQYVTHVHKCTYLTTCDIEYMDMSTQSTTTEIAIYNTYTHTHT